MTTIYSLADGARGRILPTVHPRQGWVWVAWDDEPQRHAAVFVDTLTFDDPRHDGAVDCDCDDCYDGEQLMCECELDFSCPLHRHLPTPEDRIATAWSNDRP